MTALTKTKIDVLIKEVPAWSKRRQSIHRTFKFDGFLQAIDFVNQIAKHAQRLNHTRILTYDKVILTLTTHDAGGVTQNDFTLAGKCDAVFGRS